MLGNEGFEANGPERCYILRPHTVPPVQTLAFHCKLPCLICWTVGFQELSCPLGNVLLYVGTGHESIVSHTSLYNDEVKEKGTYT